MTTLNNPATRSTPAICFEPMSGNFELSGISIPENATEFYEPVVAWLAQNLPSLQGEHVMNFRLSYFNSASLKCIYLVLKEVKTAREKGVSMQVRWHADADDDLLTETVATFTEVLDMPMDLVILDDGRSKAADPIE